MPRAKTCLVLAHLERCRVTDPTNRSISYIDPQRDSRRGARRDDLLLLHSLGYPIPELLESLGDAAALGDWTGWSARVSDAAPRLPAVHPQRAPHHWGCGASANLCTTSLRRTACRRRFSATEALWSTSAEFCWVVWSS